MLPELTLVGPVAGVGLTRSISGRKCSPDDGIAIAGLPPSCNFAPAKVAAIALVLNGLLTKFSSVVW